MAANALHYQLMKVTPPQTSCMLAGCGRTEADQLQFTPPKTVCKLAVCREPRLTKDQQQIGKDGAYKRGRHNVIQAFAEGGHTEDELYHIAKGRIQQATCTRLWSS